MKKKILFSISLILTLALIAFIFSNSLRGANDSDSQSSSVTAFINNALSSMNIDLVLSHAFVRKAAHFCEFALLGFLAFFDIFQIFKGYLTARRPRLLLCSAAAAVFSLIIASTDECLQLLSPGRAAQLSDVLLDTCGAVCGALVALCVYFCIYFIVGKARKTIAIRQKM